LLLAASLAAPVLVAEQRPGQVRPRPAEGRDPELKPPTIREYHPKSQLVTAQHPVPRAKFPVVDIHSHQPTPISAGDLDRVVAGMQANNLQILVNLSGASGERLRQGVEALRASKYKDRMVLFANVNFSGVGPGFGPRAARQLEDDIKAGAMGLKVFKDLGMFDRKADGSRLQVDDPELDPIWETCARLNVPVLIHVAEPPKLMFANRTMRSLYLLALIASMPERRRSPYDPLRLTRICRLLASIPFITPSNSAGAIGVD